MEIFSPPLISARAEMVVALSKIKKLTTLNILIINKFMESEQVMHTLFAIRAYVRTSYHRTWTPVDIIFEWRPKTKGAHHSYFYREQRYIKSVIWGHFTILFAMFYSHLLIYIILNINILWFINVCFTLFSNILLHTILKVFHLKKNMLNSIFQLHSTPSLYK